MKILFVLLCSFSLLFGACEQECSDCESLLFEANVVVTDIFGKPIGDNKMVAVDGRATEKLITDKDGRIKFNDVWNTGNYTATWKLSFVDTASLVGVNFLEPPSFYAANQKFTINDTIKVDSLKPITVRLKSSKTTLTGLYLSAFADKRSVNGAVTQPINREFIKLDNRIPKSQLDTTIQFKAYSKIGFTIQGGVRFNAVDYSGKTILLKDFEKRDSFTIEL